MVGPSVTENFKNATWRLALDVPIQTGNMESRLQAVERIPSEGGDRLPHYIPIRFVSFNKLSRDDKLLIALEGLAMSEALGCQVSVGKIIHGDNPTTVTVCIPLLIGEVRKIRGKMVSVLASDLPPDLA